MNQGGCGVQDEECRCWIFCQVDGRGRSDSTKFDVPRMFETAQDEMLEVKAKNIIEKVIHERPQDIESERPQPMSKL